MNIGLRVGIMGFFLIGSVTYGGTVPKPPKMTPELIQKGMAVYTTNCLSCHGEKGDGNGPAGAYMNPKPRNFGEGKFKAGGKPEQLFKTVTSGLSGTAMAPFGHLPEEDRWAVIYYVTDAFIKKKK